MIPGSLLVKIGELGRVVTGTTPSRGDLDAWGDEIPFVTPSDINDASRFAAPERYLSSDIGHRLASRLLPKDAVCFTCIGSIGKISMTDRPSVTNQQINSIVIDNAEFDARFVYYTLRADRTRIRAIASGSATPIINKSAFEQWVISVPPIVMQRAVADVLGVLGETIDCNQSVMRLAGDLAGALFRAMFELEGTAQSRLGDLADVVDCLHSGKPEWVGDSPHRYLVLADIRDDGRLQRTPNFTISEEEYQAWTRRIEVRVGDCVITNVGRVGAVAQIPSGVQAAVGRNMTALRGHDDCPSAYLVEALRCSTVRREIETKTDHGTVLAALNVRTIPDLLLPAGDLVARTSFQETAGPLHALQDALLHENTQLAALRDVLLPGLLSGALRVRDVEPLVGETP